MPAYAPPPTAAPGFSLFQFFFPEAAARLRDLAARQPLPPEVQQLLAPGGPAPTGLGTAGAAPGETGVPTSPVPVTLPVPPPLATPPQVGLDLRQPADVVRWLLAQNRVGEAAPLHLRLPLVVNAGQTETLTVRPPGQAQWCFVAPIRLLSTGYDTNLTVSLTADSTILWETVPLVAADAVEYFGPTQNEIALTVSNLSSLNVTVVLALDGAQLITDEVRALIEPWIEAVGSVLTRTGIALLT